MIKTKTIKIEKEEQKVVEAFCSFCEKEFDPMTAECIGFGQMHISFGFGSEFDDDTFSLEICDDCFMKGYYHLLIPQFEKKKYNLIKLEEIRKTL